ncbi:MAG: molybdate ABC transporter substrate-binding protein, partial [Acidobacteriota bacterium]
PGQAAHPHVAFMQPGWLRSFNYTSVMFKRAMLLITIHLCFQCGLLFSAEIYCLAAASLSDALETVGDQFTNETGVKVVLNFGASSLLARQIEEGSPGDLFISADEEKVDQLQQKRLVIESTRRSLLSNTLVIVTARDSGIQLQSGKDLRLLKGRLALAEYQSVPAGIYAKKYLTSIGLWKELSSRLVPVQNVRAALAAVESGNVETAIVYKTDAGISSQVRIAYEIPQQIGPAISYSIVMLKRSKDPSSAKKFYDYLMKPSSLNIFRRFGFIPLTP